MTGRKLPFAVVIPARYASSRLPGKPLALIAGKPMIQRVWEVAKASSAARVIVATDDDRIVEVVKGFGGEAMMTSATCASGTDRVAEVAKVIVEDVVVNLQGDEPAMDPSVIDAVAAPLLSDPAVAMSTAALPIEGDEAEFAKASVVKVVVDDRGDALYFSRAPIPHHREGGQPSWRKHLGIYGYRRETLFRVAAMMPSTLEKIEVLEQMRVLQSGGRIRVVDVGFDSVGVDTPDDLKAAEASLCARNGR